MRTLILTLASLSLMAADLKPGPETTPMQPFLGVQLGEVDEALAYHLGLQHDLGILVRDVVPGSPAAAMGLKPYDVIIRANNADIYTPRALSTLVSSGEKGQAMTIIVRRGSDEVSLLGELSEHPVPPPCDEQPWPGNGGFPADIQEQLQRRMHDNPQRNRDHQNNNSAKGGAPTTGEVEELPPPGF